MASNPDIDGSGTAAGRPHAVVAAPVARRLRVLQGWFYLGVPLLLGFLFGWLRVGRAAEWPLDVALVYWTGVALASTALLAATTALLAPALRRWRCPLWLTLFAGQLVGGALLVDPALTAFRAALRATLLPGMAEPAMAGWGEVLQRMPSNALLWVGLNLLFFHGLRMPRFGYEPAADPMAVGGAPSPGSGALQAQPAVPQPGAPAGAASAATSVARREPVAPATGDAVPGLPRALPPFMERVRPERRGTLLALEADGHYLRVHTDAGSDLVLYRLTDALREVGADDGARVHRSWWVARGALAAERRRESLKLVNGLEVPVSRSYRLAARERGWLSGTGDS